MYLYPIRIFKIYSYCLITYVYVCCCAHVRRTAAVTAATTAISLIRLLLLVGTHTHSLSHSPLIPFLYEKSGPLKFLVRCGSNFCSFPHGNVIAFVAVVLYFAFVAMLLMLLLPDIVVDVDAAAAAVVVSLLLRSCCNTVEYTLASNATILYDDDMALLV